MAVVKLPDHSHCGYCGDPIPFGEDYCNDYCKNTAEADKKKENIRDLAFYCVIGVAILILVYRFML